MVGIGTPLADLHGSIQRHRVFLNDDRVSPHRQRRAGENAHSFSRSDMALKGMAGGSLPDHLQPHGQLFNVGAPDGVAVHGRGIEWRLGQACRERFGKDAPGGLRDRHQLRGRWRDVRDNSLQSLFDRQRHEVSALLSLAGFEISRAAACLLKKTNA